MVLITLAGAHGQEPAFKINILNPEFKAFLQAEPAAVYEPGHQTVGVGHSAYNLPHLLLGENDGQPAPAFGAHRTVQICWVPVQGVTQEEKKGIEGLVLGCCGDLPFNREMGEKITHIV